MACVIYGNGAIARLVLAYVARDRALAGFTVESAYMPDGEAELAGYPLVPFENVEAHFAPADHEMIVAVGYPQMNRIRERIAAAAEEKGYSLGRYVHPDAVMAEDIALGQNCVVLDHTSIHPGTVVEDHAFISSNVNIGHDCRIGHGTWINAGVALGGGVTVGSRCFFGMNAAVAHGVDMGAETFVGPQALVGRSTSPSSVLIVEPAAVHRLDSQTFGRFAGLWDGEASTPCPD